MYALKVLKSNIFIFDQCMSTSNDMAQTKICLHYI